MKELSIEEKAKRYDTALEIAKEYFKANQKIGDLDENDTLLGIFPELKGSEDEQIREWIIDDIKYNMNNELLNNSEYIKKAEKAIAWLEKQGNEKDIHLLELKAQAYDDAKERMSYAYNQNRVPIGFISEIFPNLNSYEKQSEQKTC